MSYSVSPMMDRFLAESISEIVGEYGTRPLYKLLGYFSVIGLLRVHSLLGDFTLALKVMENVELNQKVYLYMAANFELELIPTRFYSLLSPVSPLATLRPTTTWASAISCYEDIRTPSVPSSPSSTSSSACVNTTPGVTSTIR